MCIPTLIYLIQNVLIFENVELVSVLKLSESVNPSCIAKLLYHSSVILINYSNAMSITLD